MFDRQVGGEVNGIVLSHNYKGLYSLEGSFPRTFSFDVIHFGGDGYSEWLLSNWSRARWKRWKLNLCHPDSNFLAHTLQFPGHMDEEF